MLEGGEISAPQEPAGRRLYGYNGVRVGEAKNPGPDCVVVSGNCTSFLRHAENIMAINAQVLALQEVRLTTTGMQIASDNAAEAGWTTL